MAPNSARRRAVLANAGAAVLSYVSGPIGWIGQAVAATASVSSLFTNVSGALASGRKLFYPVHTLGDIAHDVAKRRTPSIAPLVGALTVLSVAEIGMLLKFIKAFASFLRRDPSVVDAQAAFAYKTKGARFSLNLPWNLLLSLVSIIVLVVNRKNTSKYLRAYRWIAVIHMLSNLIKMYCVMHWSWLKSPIGSRYVTKLISHTLQADALSSSEQRQVFVASPLVRSKPTDNHTHGKSAACRNAGSATAALVAYNLGKEPYYVQQSLSDVRKGRVGDRSYHWIKDLAIPARDFAFDPVRQAAVLVDVDHYIDMPNMLARFPATYFISTFQPSTAAVSEGEFSFRFTRNNEVQYRVSGGAMYEHAVWDYKGDTILAEISSLTKRFVVAYHVDRKKLHDHHMLIMLTVIGRFSMPSIVPTWLVVKGTPLERLRPVENGHVVLDIVRHDGLFRSVAILGDYTSVTLPMAQFDAAHAVASVAKVPITPAMVASNIAPSDAAGLPMDRLQPGHAAIVSSYIRAGVPFSPPVIYPPSECVVPVYFGKHDYDAPVPMKAFGSPLIGPCYTYATSIGSDDRCIAGRVEAFTFKSQFVIPPKLAGYMVEFAERLIPVPHLGVPLGLDEVQQRQDRPTQRHILDEASVSGKFFKTNIKAFVKKETAVKPSDPRNISTLVPQVKLAYSSYLYAYHEEVMARQPWYAFRYTPKECAERVCEVLSEASHSVCADAGRFDGHVNRTARVFERMCLLRQFDRRYHSELNELLDKQVGLPGTTTEGRKYATGDTRGSGSPETSDMNSTDTAFIGYCSWRETKINGFFCTPDQAWSELGLYGGDDSLEGAVDPAALKRCSTLVGQEYKIKTIPRGALGVEFLNRQFGPDVWTGDSNSLANPSRLLSKLWVGPASLPQPLERFAERASGYYRMDRNSPVIGKIVRVAHDLLGERTEGLLMPWAGRIELDSNWPNEDSGWMIDVFNASIPDFDFERFFDWIQKVETCLLPELLLQAPLCTSAKPHPEPSTTCVIGSEIVHFDKKATSDEMPATEITFGTLPPGVAEADALQPFCRTNGLKDTSKRAPKEADDARRIKTNPATWTYPANSKYTETQWQEWRAKMAIRWGKQSE